MWSAPASLLRVSRVSVSVTGLNDSALPTGASSSFSRHISITIALSGFSHRMLISRYYLLGIAIQVPRYCLRRQSPTDSLTKRPGFGQQSLATDPSRYMGLVSRHHQSNIKVGVKGCHVRGKPEVAVQSRAVTVAAHSLVRGGAAWSRLMFAASAPGTSL
jgi:hypothetical protein